MVSVHAGLTNDGLGQGLPDKETASPTLCTSTVCTLGSVQMARTIIKVAVDVDRESRNN